MANFDPSWCARLRPTAGAAPLPSGSPYRARQVPLVHHCERCAARMFDHHCKIVCPNCGYRRDCSDP
jgi:hypothetical protein